MSNTEQPYIVRTKDKEIFRCLDEAQAYSVATEWANNNPGRLVSVFHGKEEKSQFIHTSKEVADLVENNSKSLNELVFAAINYTAPAQREKLMNSLLQSVKFKPICDEDNN